MILRRSAPTRLQRMASFIRPLQELLPRIIKLIRGGFKIQPIRILKRGMSKRKLLKLNNHRRDHQ